MNTLNSIHSIAQLTLKVIDDNNFQNLVLKPKAPVQVTKVKLKDGMNADNTAIYLYDGWISVTHNNQQYTIFPIPDSVGKENIKKSFSDGHLVLTMNTTASSPVII